MKINGKEIRRRLKIYFTAWIAILALLVAGSENPYFPWPNVGGVMVLAVIAAITAHEEEKLYWEERDLLETPENRAYEK